VLPETELAIPNTKTAVENTVSSFVFDLLIGD